MGCTTAFALAWPTSRTGGGPKARLPVYVAEDLVWRCWHRGLIDDMERDRLLAEIDSPWRGGTVTLLV